MNTAQIIPFRFEAREVRTLLIDDQPWFCVVDICRILDYSNSRDALSKHCREAGVAKRDVRSGGQARNITFINEGNLYRLIFRSRKEEAQKFESWVCDEVLPAIRKRGRYEDEQGKLGTLIGKTIGTDGFHMLGALVAGRARALPTKLQRRAKMKLWAQLHAAYGVRSAEDIPAAELDSARQFVAAYAIEGEYIESGQRSLPHAERLNYPAKGDGWRHGFRDLFNNGWNTDLEPFLNKLKGMQGQDVTFSVGDVSGLIKELHSLMYMVESGRMQMARVQDAIYAAASQAKPDQ